MEPPPPVPEISLSASLRRMLGNAALEYDSLEAAEQRGLVADLASPLAEEEAWRQFRSRVANLVESRGYVVVRGAALDDGRSLLLVATIIGSFFCDYGDGRVVKRFRMSPWTEELSHTLAEGNFHTDGNVAETPPVATAMQCESEDPGGDAYAELRIAHLPDLLCHLDAAGAQGAAAISFLTDEEVPMAHGRSPRIWSGRLVTDGAIRYHPESLRVANARSGRSPDRLEAMIATIHRSALAVTAPFHLRAGDILLVSNRRALHYRGACSVRFRRFPLEFDTRSVLVLHRAAADA